jgi:hypothetical protein
MFWFIRKKLVGLGTSCALCDDRCVVWTRKTFAAMQPFFAPGRYDAGRAETRFSTASPMDGARYISAERPLVGLVRLAPLAEHKELLVDRPHLEHLVRQERHPIVPRSSRKTEFPVAKCFEDDRYQRKTGPYIRAIFDNSKRSAMKPLYLQLLTHCGVAAGPAIHHAAG